MPVVTVETSNRLSRNGEKLFASYPETSIKISYRFHSVERLSFPLTNDSYSCVRWKSTRRRLIRSNEKHRQANSSLLAARKRGLHASRIQAWTNDNRVKSCPVSSMEEFRNAFSRRSLGAALNVSLDGVIFTGNLSNGSNPRPEKRRNRWIIDGNNRETFQLPLTFVNISQISFYGTISFLCGFSAWNARFLDSVAN